MERQVPHFHEELEALKGRLLEMGGLAEERVRAAVQGLVSRDGSRFDIWTSTAIVIAYALLGATWLVMKSEGTLQVRSYRMAFGLGIATIVVIAAVSAATPFLSIVYWQRWFAWPQC